MKKLWYSILIIFFAYCLTTSYANYHVVNVWVSDSFGEPFAGATVNISGPNVYGENERQTYSKGVCSFFVINTVTGVTETYTITATDDDFAIDPHETTVSVEGATPPAYNEYNVHLTAVAGKIAGTVTLDTGDPITTESISVENVDTGYLASDFADSTGHYELTVPPGTYTIQPGLGGFIFDESRPTEGNTYVPEESIDVYRGLVTAHDFIIPDTSITGHVYDINGNPISELNVMLSPEDEECPTILPETTDSNGWYSFDFIPLGTYTLRVLTQNTSHSYKKIITLDMDNRHINRDFSINYVGKIQGNVYIDAEDEVRVEAIEKSSGKIYMSFTNPEGNYMIKGLKTGTYETTASVFSTPEGAIVHDECFPPSPDVTLTVEDHDATLDFYSYPGRVHLHCPFTDTSTTVTLCKQEDDTLKIETQAVFESAETVTFKYFPPGTYTIFGKNKTHAVAKKEFTITDDTPIDVSLTSGSTTLAVHVTDPPGDPLEGANVHLMLALTGVDTSMITDAEGNASFTGLVVDNFTNSGYDVGRLTISKDSYSEVKRAIMLVEDETLKEISTTLHPAPIDISGTVEDKQTGTPLTDVPVKTVDQVTSSIATAITDEQGNFEIPGIAPGLYAISATKEEYANYEKTNVNLSDGSVITIRMTPAEGSISGITYKDDGITPMPDVYLNASSDTSLSGNQAVSDEEGNYEITDLAPGDDYSLLAIPPDMENYNHVEQSPIVVEENQTTSVNIRIPLKEQ